jgi:hypothetical protein
MLIGFDTINFSWETKEDGTNNLIIMCSDIGTLPATEVDKVTLESAIKLGIAKIVNR